MDTFTKKSTVYHNSTVIKKDDSVAIAAFLLGLLQAEGVSTLFKVGNTDISISQVYCVAMMFFLLFKRPNSVIFGFKKTPKLLIAFFTLCIFSILPGVLHFGSINVAYRYFVGLIQMFIAFTAFIVAISLRDQYRHILKGFLIGLMLNVIWSFIMYITFKAGHVITLNGIFISRLNYIPIYSFRSQGLFLEPSHFIRFIISVFLPVVVFVTNEKKIFVKAISIITLTFGIFVILLSTSGSVVIGVIGFIMYILISRRRKKVTFKGVIVGLIIMFAVAICLVTGLIDNNKVFKLVQAIFTGANIRGTDNLERYESMLSFLHLIPKVPLGCGFNLTGTLITTEGVGTVSAFSELLEMTVEVGILGMLIYVIFIISTAKRLLLQKNNYATSLAVSLLSILALQAGTDYPFDSTTIMLILGLCVAQTLWKKNPDTNGVKVRKIDSKD
jgi:preprotein translocase subunit Sss1